MSQQQLNFLFLNIGHFLDHLFVLIFATVAALKLTQDWGMSYAELIPYATPGFIAFGLCAVPAGWLADKWSREGMMVVFFFGIGLASILTSFATTPIEISMGLCLVGVFGAIYHPVGLAMVVQGRTKTGVPLAINGVFGNMGVASAALLTGYMIDTTGWRNAFIAPGILSMLVGGAYLWFVVVTKDAREAEATAAAKKAIATLAIDRALLIRIFGIIFFSTAVGGLIFQSTTFALPKVFDERLTTLADSASDVGLFAFMVFTIAAFAQLVVGYLVDNKSAKLVFAWVAGLQIVGFIAMTNLQGVAALIAAVGFMLVVFGQIPINDVLVGRMARSEWRARVFSLRYVITFSVSATAVPLIAWIHANWGFDALFTVLAIGAGCILAAVLLLPGNNVAILPPAKQAT